MIALVILLVSSQLTWIWSQGTASIRVVFTDGWKDIVMTTLQAMVALLFNRTPVLTINDMASMTGIDKANLKRIVAPMCCAKGFKIIKKTPPTPVIKDEDLLEFDYTYKNSKRVCSSPHRLL